MGHGPRSDTKNTKNTKNAKNTKSRLENECAVFERFVIFVSFVPER